MANFKACVSHGCEADTNTDKWAVAGISISGKVEWWCVECAQKLTAQHKSLDAARLARQSQKVRNPPFGKTVETDSDCDIPTKSQQAVATRGGGVKNSCAVDSDDSDWDLAPPAKPPARAQHPELRGARFSKGAKALASKKNPPEPDDSDDDIVLPSAKPPSISPAKVRKTVTVQANNTAAKSAAAAKPSSMVKSRPVEISDSDDEDIAPAKSIYCRPLLATATPKKAAQTKRAPDIDSDSD